MYCENCGKINNDNDDFCIYCGKDIGEKHEIVLEKRNKLNIKKTRIKKLKKIFLIIVGLVAVLVVVILIFNNNSATTQPSVSTEGLDLNETNNIKAVVNILCDNEYGGSGTMMTEDGIVMTNNHVISGATWCLVTIPDSATGEPIEIYIAKPILIDKISEKYDIALLEISDVYTDDENYMWGKYPNTFVSFKTPSTCTDNPWKLGETLRVYGYPSTSNNYNLTVTDGVISNFDDGYILTSAKIDSGNSGGLAVNQEGCMVGIPSAVLTGDYQNLGVIISPDIIREFLNQASNEY